MKALQITLRLMLPLLILVGGYFAWNSLKNSKPKEKQQATANIKIKNPNPNQIKKAQISTETPAHPAELIPLELVDYEVILPSRGESVAGAQTEIVAETEGRITQLSEGFEVGAYLSRGDILITLEQDDLRADVAIAEARVAQSEAALAQEKARAEQALLNWNDIGYDEEPGDLVLRKPQLKQAEASLKAAMSQVEKAQRELERSIIRVPYDCIVAERLVSLGDQLNRGRKISSIIGTDYTEISLPIAAKDEIHLPTQLQNLPVTFRNPLLGESSPTWHGVITHREPQVDENTKQLHLRARINDPYGLNTEGAIPLPVGQPVTAMISGKSLEKVYVVPKSALRNPAAIHIARQDLILRTHKIEPLWTSEDEIVFRSEIEEGSHWVKTVIKSGGIGMQLTHKQEELESEDAPSDKSSDKSSAAVHSKGH